jgi:D-alanyl-D-alanine carboxypeptidase
LTLSWWSLLTDLRRDRHDVSMTHIQAAHVIALIGIGLFGGCRHTAEDASASLDAALSRVVDASPDDDVRSGVMAVDAPRFGIHHVSVAGLAHAGVPMTAETAFFSASVGKLCVAAAVLSLAKDGVVDLDAPFASYVDFDLVRGLPVEGGDDALARVTVRQLLSHRSGLPDYFSDPSADGAPRLFDRIATEPDRTYSRADLLDYARAHYRPVGAPGTVFHYADTNFDVLGLVLEGATGASSFTSVVRSRVLEPFGLTRTWYHAVEPAPLQADGTPTPIADIFVNGVNMSGFASLSADQAGGGLITTIADLERFVRGLAAGGPIVFDDFGDDFTLDAMHSGIDVGLTLWRIRPGGVFFLLGSMPELVGHSGATGVWAYYAADIDAVFVGAVSASAWQEKHIEFLLADVVPIVTGTTPVTTAP